MTVMAKTTTTVTVALNAGDLHRILEKSGLVPPKFGPFWKVTPELLPAGGLKLTFEASATIPTSVFVA